MVPASATGPPRRATRGLAALAAAAALVAAASLLAPRPLADAFFAGWVVLAVGLATVGAAAVWADRTPVAWLAAILLSALAVVGMWSIGVFIAPAALLLLSAAAASQVARSRAPDRSAAAIDRPAPRTLAGRAVVGAAVAVAGAWLVYEGAIARQLFDGACARETLACALHITRWGGVGVTLLGLAALGLGGRLLWRQGVAVRALVAD